MMKLNALNLGGSSLTVLEDNLRKLDNSVIGDPAAKLEVIICGAACILLQGMSFRATTDIDFAVIPAAPVVSAIQNNSELSALFGLKSVGVINLLCDFEDRLVTVDPKLHNLEVRCLSLADWVVSKLGSPKLSDALDLDEVTLDVLLQAESLFPLYGGTNDQRAFNNLQYLIRSKKEVETRLTT